MKTVSCALSAISHPLRRAGIAVSLMLLVLFIYRGVGQSREAQPAAALTLPKLPFGPDGSISLPDGFRRWEHVGTRVKTSGHSILDGTVILRPQVLDTYVEPTAFAEYERTGAWPDGAQITKELSVIKVGGDCDKVTFACSLPAGDGIFEDSFIGVGLMVKDRKRFADAPGNWGYFRFFAHGPAYTATSLVLPASQCQSCHVEFASNEDYVFTDTHIGLTSANIH